MLYSPLRSPTNRSQPVAAEAGQVPKRFRVVQKGQPSDGLSGESPELPDILTLKELQRFPVPESCYHLYALRKGYKTHMALSTPPIP